jgi:hypothetical protein
MEVYSEYKKKKRGKEQRRNQRLKRFMETWNGKMVGW